ncbi:MAG: PEP-utilizing enzyme [Nitrososphaerota archaeon]
MERENLWEKWMKEELKAEEAIWGVSPGLDLIPEVDLPLYNSFFLDGTHSAPPLSPLSLDLIWARGCTHGLKYVNSYFSLPTCYGWEGRATIDGGIYWAFLIERDEKKIKEREEKFREALKPFIEDFDGMWNKIKQHITKRCEDIKTLIKNTQKNWDYAHLHWELEQFIIRDHWENHFLGMQSSYSAWILLEQECKTRFGISDKTEDFQDMLRGFENEVYVVDKEMWLLAKEATEMGFETVFKERGLGEIIKELEVSNRGKEWLKKFGEFLERRGWRSVSFDMADPYWLEKPELALDKIKTLIVSGEAKKPEFLLEERRKELSSKREIAVKKMLEKVPAPDRDYFQGLINLAQKASPYSEEHDLFFEMTFFAIAREGYKKIGEYLAENGAIDVPEDVFMLNGREIERCLMAPKQCDMRWITRKRRKRWEECKRKFAAEGEFRPPVYTTRANLEEAVAMDLLPAFDPICIKIVVGELPEVSAEELGADLMGICGCPGVAEGVARVITDYSGLKELKEGEILVCPQTGPEWTIGFAIAAGVITDRGGTLSHAAIIGREYGVPTIVNTFVATSKIKTGQRIRMDASKGAIYILDKEK